MPLFGQEVVADGIVRALRRQTAMQAGQQIPVTASVGVALFDGLADIDPLAAVDLAMFDAKDAGRDRCALYRPPADARPRSSSRLAYVAERFGMILAIDSWVVQQAVALIAAHAAGAGC